MVAPSQNIARDAVDWPFSVEPDNPVSVQDVISIHRDYFTGIEDLDVTMNPAYYVGERLSPLASPFGPTDLHRLLGITAQRSIATRSSVFVNVVQVRDWLPEPVKAVLWHGAGPAASTLHVPIHSGVTELPDEWTYTPKTDYDRDSAWWAFRLVDGLSLIKWQDAIKDIKAVRDPAEAALFVQQDEIESIAVDLYNEPKGWGGEKAAKEFLTRYTNLSMTAVSDAYWELFDYLLFKYYFREGEYVTRTLSSPYPEVIVPEVDQILTMVPPIGPPQGPPAVVPPRR
jgi:dipeptidase